MEIWLTAMDLGSVLSASTVDGQDIATSRLCEDSSVDLAPGRAGIIQYIRNDTRSNRNCTLTLRGFDIGSHVIFLNVEDRAKTSGSSGMVCEGGMQITIDGSSFCSGQGDTDNVPIIVQVTSDQIEIFLSDPADVQSFTTEYCNSGMFSKAKRP